MKRTPARSSRSGPQPPALSPCKGEGDQGGCAAPSLDSIYARLDQVYDPELDESIVRLGFVDEVRIDGNEVTVVYKLPTFWCAPNFAYMMSADVREQVEQAPGVYTVRVVLRDHFADTEINGGVNGGRAFREAFPGEALDDLDELRRKFLEKSFLARQEQLIRRLRQAGLGDQQIVGLRVADVEPQGEDVLVGGPSSVVSCLSQQDMTRQLPTMYDQQRTTDDGQRTRVRLAAGDLEKYLRKRAGLGLPADGAARLFSELSGAPLRAEELAGYLRRSRTVRVGMAFNSTMCEGLLRARYHPELNEDTTSVGDVLLASH